MRGRFAIFTFLLAGAAVAVFAGVSSGSAGPAATPHSAITFAAGPPHAGSRFPAATVVIAPERRGQVSSVACHARIRNGRAVTGSVTRFYTYVGQARGALAAFTCAFAIPRSAARRVFQIADISVNYDNAQSGPRNESFFGLHWRVAG
jgi:hypothetical protein